MNYFDDLLESYQKLKSRKLVLTEAIDVTSDETLSQAAQLAKAAVQTVLTSGATKEMPTQIMTPEKGTTAAWVRSADTVSIMDNGAFGFYPQGFPAKIELLGFQSLQTLSPKSNLYKFIVGFAPANLEDKDQDGVPDSDEAGNPVTLPEDAKKILIDTADIIPRLQSRLYHRNVANATERIGQQDFWRSKNTTLRYLMGNAKESIERKLTTSTKLVTDGMQMREAKIPDTTVIECCKTINRLAELAIEGPKSEADAFEFQRMVARTDGDNIIVFNQGDPSEGIVIKSNQLLDAMYDEVINQVSAKFKKLKKGDYVPKFRNIKGSTNANTLNNIRGKVMESNLVMSHLLGMIRKRPELKNTLTAKALKVIERAAQNDTLLLDQAFQWKMLFDLEERTPDLGTFEDMALFDNIAENFGGTAAEAIKNMIKRQVVVDKATIERGSDIIIPVGQSTAISKSDDVLEGYVGPDALARARSALLHSGFKEEDLANGIELTSIQDLVAQNPEYGEIYADLYNPNDQVAYHRTSLKNHIAGTSVKLAETTLQSVEDTIVQSKSGALRRSARNLGIDYMGGSNYISRRLTSMRQAVEKTFAHSILINKNTGKEIDSGSIKVATVDSILKTLKKHLNYSELKKSDIQAILKDKSAKDLTDPYTLSKIGETLTRRLFISTLKKDLKGTSRTARHALALIFRGLGGVDAPTLMDSRDLPKGTQVTCEQNALIEHYLSKFMNKEMDIVFNDYSVRLEDPFNPKRNLVFGMFRKDVTEEGGIRAKPRANVTISKAAMEFYSKKNQLESLAT